MLGDNAYGINGALRDQLRRLGLEFFLRADAHQITGFHHHWVMAVLANLFGVVVFLGAKNSWCGVGARVNEDASVASEVSRLRLLLRQKV